GPHDRAEVYPRHLDRFALIRTRFSRPVPALFCVVLDFFCDRLSWRLFNPVHLRLQRCDLVQSGSKRIEDAIKMTAHPSAAQTQQKQSRH
ncbi:MAG: hypothetical protein ACREKE_05430, partial [bacterium]